MWTNSCLLGLKEKQKKIIEMYIRILGREDQRINVDFL